jgi:hypothetical protein
MSEFLQGNLHLEEKLVSHLRREAVTDEYALDDEILTVGRHGVSGDKPSLLA